MGHVLCEMMTLSVQAWQHPMVLRVFDSSVRQLPCLTWLMLSMPCSRYNSCVFGRESITIGIQFHHGTTLDQGFAETDNNIWLALGRGSEVLKYFSGVNHLVRR